MDHLSLIKLQPFEIIAEALGTILSGCSKMESLVISQSQLSFEDRAISRRSSYEEEMIQTKHVLLESIFEHGQHLRKIEIEHILLGVPFLRRLVCNCKHLQVVNFCVCNKFYVQILRNTQDVDAQRIISRIKFNISDDCVFQFCSPVPMVMSDEAKKIFSMFKSEHLYSNTSETEATSKKRTSAPS